MRFRLGPGACGRVSGVALLAVLAVTGCSTTAMKGTPFFTGEYDTRTGPVEDRVNLWPLLYYREPALSVLWPFAEYSGDRLAVRPFFSIEEMDEEKSVYNVLWPLGRFDTRSKDYRFFPFYWGDDYRVVFPLYWHYDKPFAAHGKGSDSLWPLWCCFRDQEQYSLHLLWPFFNTKSYDDERGWRLWPLYGSYERPPSKSGRSYALWPLAWHTWRGDAESWTVLPLFYSAGEPDGDTFATLLGGWQRDRSADTTSWFALPLLGWGSSTPETSRSSALLGLYGSRRDSAQRSSRLLPFYYRSETLDGRLFLSPLYASGGTSNGASWRVVVPLAVHAASPTGSALYTPLYSQGTDTAAGSRWSCLLPLYYEDRSPAGSTLVTPLGGRWTDAAHRGWAVYPLLSGGRRRADGGDLWLGGPIFHASWDATGTSHWLLPLYTYNHNRDSFLSLLYSAWDNDRGGATRVVPPLLSGFASRTNRWDLWALAGLGHASGGRDAGSSHLFPLFYSNRRDDTFVSLFYASWEADENRMRTVPVLLSGWRTSADSGEVLGLLGLFRARWGESDDAETGHLFPLYYYDRDTLLTPLLGHWSDAGVISRYWLTPLFGTRSGHASGSWLLPFYSHTSDPVSEQSHGWFLGLGNYRRTLHESRTAFPLLFEHEGWHNEADPRRRRGVDERDGWRLNVLLLAQGASYDYTRALRTDTSAKADAALPPGMEDLHRSECRFLPLWNYKSDRSVTGNWERAKGSFLLCLYDYRRERGRVPPDHAVHDYVRRRVLFRLYHHEKLNGATSIDIFPAVTYDRDPDAGKRKISLLWRLFRYERSPEKASVDLLFLPVWRSAHTRLATQ